MRSVNIAELKNKLSTYVRYAKAGETVIVRDRNTAVAQLVPMPKDDGLSEDERYLIARGLMRPRKELLDLGKLRNMPRKYLLPENAGIKAVLDDRNEGL